MSATSGYEDVEHKHLAQQNPPVVAVPVCANPAPLGLSGFALTTFVLSLHNAGAGVPADGPHGVVTGLAMFYGGLIQILAGMWEFKAGNTFGATAFSSFGGFWLSFAMIYIPSTNIIGSYGTDTALLGKSVGYYLLGWTIFVAIMLIASHRTNVAFVSLFFFLLLTFIMLTAGQINNSLNCQVAGGALGVVTSVIAWYIALAGLLTKETSYFTLPLGPLN